MKLFTLTLLFVIALDTSAQTLIGSWEVNGVNPDQEKYAGELEVKFIGKSIYQLEWNILYDGQPEPKTYPGTGFYSGDTDKFIVAYGMDTKLYGLISYDLNDLGGLEGTAIWTSHNGRGAELIGGRLGKSVIEGNYEVVGRRPLADTGGGNSQTYKGTLKISRSGKRYHMEWNSGDNRPYNGFGYVSGNKLIGVWGVGDDYGVETYTVNEDMSLATSKWTSPTFDFRQGTETIIKKE